MNDSNQPAVSESYGSGSANLRLWVVIGQALLKGFLVALPIAIVLAGIVVGILCLVVEPEYQSTATLMILEKRPYLVFDVKDLSVDFAETQLELLRDPYIVGQAVEFGGLMDLPELREIKDESDVTAWIRNRLTAARVGKSELYQVTFTARHPESAQAVLTSIVGTYLKFAEYEWDSQRQRMMELLQEERKVREGDVDRKRETLREISKINDLREHPVLETAPNEPSRPAGAGPLTLLAGLEQRAIHSEIETGILRDRVAALRTEQAQPIRVSENQLAAALSQEPGIVQLTRELKRAQRKLDSEGSADPSAAAGLRDEITAKEKELETRKADFRPILKEEMEVRRALEQREALSLAESRFESETKTLDSLRERIAVERRKRQGSGDPSLELAFARDELKRAEDVYRLIGDRITQLSTESRALSQVKIVAEAKIPPFPSEPPPAKNPVIAGTVAFVAPFVVCLPLAVGTALVRRKPRPQQGQSASV